MRWVRWTVFFGYLALLTVLLLAPDPAKIVHVKGALLDRGVHFTAFFLLAVFAHTARWPRPPRRMILALALYGCVFEGLQWFFPPRSVEALDLTENLLGVATGSLAYWFALRRFGPSRPIVPRLQAKVAKAGRAGRKSKRRGKEAVVKQLAGSAVDRKPSGRGRKKRKSGVWSAR
jgi:VanZ family protein